MKMKSFFLAGMLLLLSATALQAQETKTLERYFDPVSSKNLLKVNLLGLPLRNFNFEYERVLSKRWSFVLGYRFMPNGKLPLGKSIFEQLADGDQATLDALNALRMSNNAITPQFRLYTGKKGYGRGFYFSPFYRYATHNLSGFTVDYQNAAGADAQMAMSGKLTSNTFGLQLGAQWLIGRTVTLDWWILGPHVGSANVSLTGKTSVPLTTQEQDDLRQSLTDVDIFGGDYTTVSVNASGASMTVSNAPWAGIKAGLSLGFRF
jgi:hypothetical protein